MRYHLRHGDLLSLESARGWRIDCLHGHALLSTVGNGSAEGRDVELRQGASYVVTAPRTVLVEA